MPAVDDAHAPKTERLELKVSKLMRTALEEAAVGVPGGVSELVRRYIRWGLNRQRGLSEWYARGGGAPRLPSVSPEFDAAIRRLHPSAARLQHVATPTGRRCRKPVAGQRESRRRRKGT